MIWLAIIAFAGECEVTIEFSGEMVESTIFDSSWCRSVHAIVKTAATVNRKALDRKTDGEKPKIIGTFAVQYNAGSGKCTMGWYSEGVLEVGQFQNRRDCEQAAGKIYAAYSEDI